MVVRSEAHRTGPVGNTVRMTFTTKRLCGVLLGVLVALTATPAWAAPPSIKFGPPGVGVGGPDPIPAGAGAGAAPSTPASPVIASPGPVTPLAVEQKLEALHYFVGSADGVIDDVAGSAVMAFQKVHGMERTGEYSDSVGAAILATTTGPAPLVPGGEAHRIEIDLTRQVLFLYEGGALSWILPVSSGTSSTPTAPARSTSTASGRVGRPAARPAVQLPVLRGRLRHPRVAVGAQLPGVARVRAHLHGRRRHPARPHATSARRCTCSASRPSYVKWWMAHSTPCTARHPR